MDEQNVQPQSSPVETVDIKEILQILANRWWIILLATIICAGIGYLYVDSTTAPEYSSTAQLYINNSSISVGSASLSIGTGDISASRNLVKTLSVILKSRLSLEEVLARLELEDKYTYEQIYNMVSASAVNDTEVMAIKVVSHDRTEAKEIANVCMEVLRARLAATVNGASAQVVDYAVEADSSLPRGFSKFTIIGAVVGCILSFGLCFVFDYVLNDTIKSTDWLKNHFGDSIPVLATIPNVRESALHRYGNYGSYDKYGRSYYESYRRSKDQEGDHQ